ncbi:hypothetical protein [Roseiarcus fermentans]|uniref:hypothetical protein n=1 Tax=Roseiarcus fermentans TaxID=1473586 RepID=UPI0011BF02F8|nr:hypothetical protein [Roseiarcus fermentans]
MTALFAAGLGITGALPAKLWRTLEMTGDLHPSGVRRVFRPHGRRAHELANASARDSLLGRDLGMAQALRHAGDDALHRIARAAAPGARRGCG